MSTQIYISDLIFACEKLFMWDIRNILKNAISKIRAFLIIVQKLLNC